MCGENISGNKRRLMCQYCLLLVHVSHMHTDLRKHGFVDIKGRELGLASQLATHCHKSRPIFRDIPQSVDAR